MAAKIRAAASILRSEVASRRPLTFASFAAVDIVPPAQAITGKESVAELLDNAFLAYNAGRLREGCRLTM